MNSFETSCQIILQLLEVWEPRLLPLSEEIISERTNSQNRSIRQILGHLVDSASNNTHRIIHLQYRENPCSFPNYATNGNNDRWIAIQNYQHENWQNLIQLWKYTNLHLVYVIRNVDQTKLGNQWQSSETELISLHQNIEGYLPHFELHLKEIEILINE
ncbi:MAG: DinB family protein [Bacteroidota bacterium]|nr:DinB family protein [Bacteroidota bacterium]MDO9613143.1 DinB family protein [Bacteroidota bacterium]